MTKTRRDKIRNYILVALLFVTMFMSQIACDEQFDGCRDNACRNACHDGDTACKIECCQA